MSRKLQHKFRSISAEKNPISFMLISLRHMSCNVTISLVDIPQAVLHVNVDDRKSFSYFADRVDTSWSFATDS